MSGKKSLTDRRKRFIAEYLKDLNATRAAERAGYAWPNVSGPVLVNTKVVRDEIDRLLRVNIMTPEEVLSRLSEQAKTDYSAYLLPSGQVDLDKMLADGKGHLIKGFKYARDGGIIVEFHDAQKALNLMAKHKGLLRDTVTQINVNLDDLTTEQLERIANGEDPLQIVREGKES